MLKSMFMTLRERAASILAGSLALLLHPIRVEQDGCAQARPVMAWTARSTRFLSRQLLKVVVAVLFVVSAVFPTQAAPPNGSQIINSAWIVSNTTPVAQSSVTVTIAQRTPATLTFYAYRPGSSLAENITIKPTEYHPGGSPAGTFNLLPPPQFNGSPLSLDAPLPLVATDTLLLHAGEPLFMTLADSDQNLNPNTAETILVTIVSDTGDTELLRLTETGNNTGIFSGYLMTGVTAGSSGDGILHVVINSQIDGLYTDIADGTDTSADTALVDPLGTVFNSATGEPVDGATVSIYRLSSGDDVGTLATGYLFADDGVTPFPATVISGDTAYNNPPGGFRFPLIEPGRYRFEITPPGGYLFPSTARISSSLPYIIVVGSRGEAFEVEPGPALRIDIPLDPLDGEMWLSKQVNFDQAAIGDFLQYQLTLENGKGVETMSQVVINDRLPLGFRYQQGSTRSNDSTLDDPQIGADGRQLAFALGDLAPGAQLTISYVVEVAAGARSGKAVNQAQAVDANDNRSNLAEASVVVREAFFRNRSLLVGRVIEGSCDVKDTEKTGVAGVRIYLEDGTYVFTDEEGKYHFEGVEPGVHVVQLDTLSLPGDYELLACEESSQFAKRSFSQFVDVKGGTIWRADFYAAQHPAAAAAAADVNQVTAESASAVSPEPGQALDQGLLHPINGNAVNRIEAVRIRLDSKLTPRVSLDQKEIPADRIGFRMTDPESKTTLYTYIGVNFGEAGSHKLLVEGLDPFGNVRFTQEAELLRTGDIASIRLVETAENLADGRTPVRIRVEIIDVFGKLVQSGIALSLENGDLRPLGDKPLGSDDSFNNYGDLGSAELLKQISVDPQGWISFNPVDRSGSYPIRLKANGTSLETEIFVKPEMRDWILVGFAQGTAGYNNLSGNKVSLDEAGMEEDFYTNNQVKFFAKGAIKGEWLLTMAYDSEKSNRDGDSLYQIIDPDSYYPLYGDGSQQGYEASSADKIFVKLEREQFSALFGDMSTGLSHTELSRYDRNMSGFKSEMQSDNFSYTVFAADTKQAFAKDEIQGDGTSGRYYFTQKNLVTNSESVTIEIRDRFRSEQIIEVKSLSRHTDYEIDYTDGSLFFKRPIPSKDEHFNPVFIVARYETLDSSNANLNYGGRVATRVLNQRVEIGATYVHEEKGSGDGDLYGTDVTVKLSPQTTLHAEAATTDTSHHDDNYKGDAYLAEIRHEANQLKALAYFREQQSGFGLGQQNGSETGTRKYGAEGSYNFNPQLSVAGLAYHEDNLETAAKRDVAEVNGLYSKDNYALHTGLRGARDSFTGGETQQSTQWLLGGNWLTPNRKLNLRGEYEQSLGSHNDNSDFPTMLTLGADYKLTEKISLFTEQEFTWGDNENTDATRVGFTATPWNGANLSTSVAQQSNENGQRVFALFGLDQSWQVNERWSIDTSVDRGFTIKQTEDNNPQFNSNVPPAHGADDDFTAVSVGATYRLNQWTWWNRLETRQADNENKYGVSTSVIGEPKQGIAVAAKALAFISDVSDGTRRTDGNIRLGLAYRPTTSRWITLNRLDFYFDKQDGSAADYDNWRIVNNLHANFRLSRKVQMSFFYGLKYVRDNYNSTSYSGFTDMIAFETRYNIDKRWDIGAHGSVLHSWNSDQFLYSLGADVGFSPVTNTWISLGYNLVGFEDEDFSDANYTAEGAYLRFRAKFDQQSVREAAEWINK